MIRKYINIKKLKNVGKARLNLNFNESHGDNPNLPPLDVVVYCPSYFWDVIDVLL